MDEPRLWLDEAKRDLRLVGAALREELYDRCLVSCQQAVEKALKAVYIRQRGRAAPRTHDIAALADQVGWQDVPELFVDLTRWYTAGRYPDMGRVAGHDPPTWEEAKAALEASTRLLKQVEEDIRA